MLEIIAILDRSGSMAGNEQDVIGGFNKFINDQLVEGTDKNVTLVLFDHEYSVVYESMPIVDVPILDNKTYYPRGSTALLDAVGKTLNSANARFLEEEPTGVLVLIYTDGGENASREYTKDKVKSTITKQKDMKDWEFLFFGADIDAFGQASSIGINASSTINISKSSAAYVDAFGSVGDTMCLYAKRKRG